MKKSVAKEKWCPIRNDNCLADDCVIWQEYQEEKIYKTAYFECESQGYCGLVVKPIYKKEGVRTKI